MNVRAQAALALHQVLVQGRSLSDVMPEFSALFTDGRDRALLQEICYGVLRHYRRLSALRDACLSKPLPKPNSALGMLFCVGLYQLQYLRVPAHAAVSATVDATTEIHETRARGLVNAVLRRSQRESEALLVKIDSNVGVAHSHPDWLINAWSKNSPTLSTLLTQNNAPAPMTLRVNSARISRDDYLQRLSSIDFVAHAHESATDAIVLHTPCDVKVLPGFADGWVSVQDAAAQLAADYLALSPSMHVLDACCAPGGKTAHMLERVPSLVVTALDNDAFRLQRVAENLARVQLPPVKLLCADASTVSAWWDGQLFDRILCDAPCSATGVIRRHPDIKWLRREPDIAVLAKNQLHMLRQLWPTLKADGILVYATCSTLATENHQVVDAFLNQTPDAELLDCQPSPGSRQIWPGEQQMDGFYYARLHKRIEN